VTKSVRSGYLVYFSLPVIEVVEVGDNDRNWKGDAQHAGDSAEGANELAGDGDGTHVAIADCSHRHDCPPEGVGDRVKLRLWINGVDFGEVNSLVCLI
jgi:hypothetical protein